MIEERIKGVENSKSTRVTDAKGAKVKQLLHDFLSYPWVDCKEAADGADGRAECGKRRTSWGPSRYRYRKSATAAPSVTNVPMAQRLRVLISCPVQALAGPLKGMCSRRPDPVAAV